MPRGDLNTASSSSSPSSSAPPAGARMSSDPAPAPAPANSASGSRKKQPPRPRGLCARCGGKPTLLLRRVVPSCTPCAHKALEARARGGMGGLESARGAALLGRSEQGREGTVALGFSGGASSRALLDVAARNLQPPPASQLPALLAAAAQEAATGKRRSRPIDVVRIDVLYVDDSAVVPGAEDLTGEVAAIVEAQGGEEAGLRFVPLRLEDVFREGDGDGDGADADAVECLVGASNSRRLRRHLSGRRPASPRELLTSLFESVNPPSVHRTAAASARTRAEDLHALLVQRLLLRTAAQRGNSALLLGENASRGAIRLIDGIAKGRAHKWAVDGAPAAWVGDVLVLRPLRETLAKEVAFYNRTRKLETLSPSSIVAADVLRDGAAAGAGAGEKASIGRLTEHFIFALEKGVPSTVNTVVRTGGKLVLRGADGDAGAAATAAGPGPSGTTGLNLGQKGERLVAAARAVPRWSGRDACPLCGLPAQEGAAGWKSKLSIVGAISGGTPAAIPQQQQQLDRADENADRDKDEIKLEDLLCYSCLLILDVPDGSAGTGTGTGASPSRTTIRLPPYVLDAALRRLALASHPTSASASAEAEAEAGAHVHPNVQLFATGPANGHAPSEPVPAPEHGNGTPTPASAGHVTRRVGRAEMEGRVGAFLLGGEDGDAEADGDADAEGEGEGKAEAGKKEASRIRTPMRTEEW